MGRIKVVQQQKNRRQNDEKPQLKMRSDNQIKIKQKKRVQERLLKVPKQTMTTFKNSGKIHKQKHIKHNQKHQEWNASNWRRQNDGNLPNKWQTLPKREQTLTEVDLIHHLTASVDWPQIVASVDVVAICADAWVDAACCDVFRRLLPKNVADTVAVGACPNLRKCAANPAQISAYVSSGFAKNRNNQWTHDLRR